MASSSAFINTTCLREAMARVTTCAPNSTSPVASITTSRLSDWHNASGFSLMTY